MLSLGKNNEGELRMKKIKAKPVSMLELFYDLIFVYAISRITAMIHHPVGGGLALGTYGEFITAIILVMQLWLYQTLYINRFGRSRLVDTVGLMISMYAAIYLANNINTTWETTFQAFNSAMLLTVGNLLWQYLCGTGKHPWRGRDERAFIITLLVEFVAILGGLLLGYRYGIYLCVFGGLVGFLMPLAFFRLFESAKVNFPHLVERLSLIIIISFGEALVNVTQYFHGALWAPLPLLIFVFLAALFGCYIIQIEQLQDHYQYTRGFVAMYSHVVMIMSLLTITVGLVYLAHDSVSRPFLVGMLTGSLLVFYLCLMCNAIYNQSEHRIRGSHIGWVLAIWLIGSLLALVWQSSNVGLMTGLTITNVGELLMMWRFARK